MSPPPRRLTFAVGTSLLTASLSFGAAGCDEPTAKPDSDNSKEQPEQLHIDEGPGTEPPTETVNPVSETRPEPPTKTVNPVPELRTEPDRVNPGPKPDPAPEDTVDIKPAPVAPTPVPKHVNTVAPSN